MNTMYKVNVDVNVKSDEVSLDIPITLSRIDLLKEIFSNTAPEEIISLLVEYNDIDYLTEVFNQIKEDLK